MRNRQAYKVIVVGAGVSGLTTAYRLLEKGYAVTVWADQFEPNCSLNAAAFWYPPVAPPANAEQFMRWARATLKFMRKVAKDQSSGITIRSIWELRSTMQSDPWWANASLRVSDFRHLTAKELPEPWADGFRIKAPVITPSVYLRWLRRKIKEMGGSIARRRITNLKQAFRASKLVVICAGLGTRSLLREETQLYPIRGQVVRVRHNGRLNKVIFDGNLAVRDPYIVPHGDGSKKTDYILLGGTFEDGVSALEPDPKQTRRILNRCSQLLPEFAATEADVLNVSCGIRPGRFQVLLYGKQTADGDYSIVNTGHGGRGYTVSYGCANEVLKILDRYVRQGPRDQYVSR